MSESGPETANAAGGDDEARHRGVLNRVRRWQLICAAIGVPVWWVAGGTRQALSFALGALLSFLSFGLLDQFTSVLGGAQRVSRTGVVLSVLRIFLIGGLLFAIMSNYSLHVIAAGTGLLTTVAAITIEALIGTLLCMNLG